jgi:hypothetical protein
LGIFYFQFKFFRDKAKEIVLLFAAGLALLKNFRGYQMYPTLPVTSSQGIQNPLAHDQRELVTL